MYDAACVFALSAATVRTDAAQAEAYAARAVALLRRAVAKGYKDIDHMRKDTDLDPLRKRGLSKVAGRDGGEREAIVRRPPFVARSDDLFMDLQAAN